MNERSPEQLVERVYKSKSKSRGLIAVVTLIAASAAGVAALSTNVISTEIMLRSYSGRPRQDRSI